jgi:hypothetical protein
MRRCLIGDIWAAAACVAACPELQREAFARLLITQADAAHRYAKRLGRAHPAWGNGSLMARALLARPPQPATADASFLTALGLVAHLLAARKSGL